MFGGWEKLRKLDVVQFMVSFWKIILVLTFLFYYEHALEWGELLRFIRFTTYNSLLLMIFLRNTGFFGC